MLQATVTGVGKTSVGFYINDHLIQQKTATLSKSTKKMVVSGSYYVPWESTGSLTYQVKLGNGEQASLSIPIEPFDFQLQPADVEWGGPAHKIIPGKNLQIKVRIHRKTRIPFSLTANTLRAIFIVDGTKSQPIKLKPGSGNSPFYADAIFNYPVPKSQSGSPDITIITDPGQLFSESDETNNQIQTQPTQSGTGSAINLAVAKGDLSFSPKSAVPGQKIQLNASIHNTSTTSIKGLVEFVFKINGQPIPGGEAKTYDAAVFKPGQAHTVSHTWTIPADTKADPTFTLVIDPGHKISGDTQSDNEASMTVPLSKPDLSASDLTCPSQGLVSGRSGELAATINNNGPSKANGVVVAYLINDQEVARKTVDIPANNFVKTSIPFTVPTLPNPTTSSVLTGTSGYQGASNPRSTIDYSVRVDVDDKIEESDEDNNLTKPVVLRVLIPTAKGTVFAKVLNDSGQPIAGANTTLISGSQQASAATDEKGYCTFTGVTFGPYQIKAAKSGYNPAQSYDASVDQANRFSFTEIVMDNKAVVTGSVTGDGSGGLANVQVEAVGTNYQTITNSQGSYTLRLPAGIYALKYVKTGYGRTYERMVISPASTTIKNVVMKPTKSGYIAGFVWGVNDEPLARMTIEAYDGAKQLIYTTSKADGSYTLDVPLPKPEMQVTLKIHGNNLSKSDTVYLIQGKEVGKDIFFAPPHPALQTTRTSPRARVVPWAECQSLPNTMYSPDYKVDAIYGMFGLFTSARIEGSTITNITLNPSPDYWLYGGVSASWNPLELFTVGPVAESINTILTITPFGIPLAMTFHSTAKTRIWVKKISVVSDGKEVAAAYPDVKGTYTWEPNCEVNWDKCRIKYYFKVDPDSDAANPAAGYGDDRVLVEWDPKTNTFTKIGHYIVSGWNENLARENYMDL